MPYHHVKDRFETEHRGSIEANNKGRLDSYILTEIKAEFSRDGCGGSQAAAARRQIARR